MYAILLSIYNLIPIPMFDGGIGVSASLCMLIVLAGGAWGRQRRLAS
jgi:Zn-dependent protease